MGTRLPSSNTAPVLHQHGSGGGVQRRTENLLHRFAALVFAPWRAWHEQRRAAACCREVLRLDRMLAAGQPWLGRDDRYRKVVAAYAVSDADHARAVLDCAQASFATWPVRRELNLRDVAHYLAVSELLAARGDSGWIQASLKRVIDSTIPPGL